METKSGEANVQKVKNWSPVWIFPIVTALIGAWILFYHYSHQGPEVTLITRPRRFGKTLNMSMLRCFFEIGTDKTLFDNLYISKRKDFCEEYMGKFPVVFLTMKGVEGNTFEKAKAKLSKLVALEAERFCFLKNSDRLTDNEKERYKALIRIKDGKYSMDEETLEHIFDRTYTGGHGFGLLNCKGIIDKYKKISSLFSPCNIQAESEPGKGSKFTFRLPCGTQD